VSGMAFFIVGVVVVSMPPGAAQERDKELSGSIVLLLVVGEVLLMECRRDFNGFPGLYRR
jgi:hypothetical protein